MAYNCLLELQQAVIDTAVQVRAKRNTLIRLHQKPSTRATSDTVDQTVQEIHELNDSLGPVVQEIIALKQHPPNIPNPQWTSLVLTG